LSCLRFVSNVVSIMTALNLGVIDPGIDRAAFHEPHVTPCLIVTAFWTVQHSSARVTAKGASVGLDHSKFRSGSTIELPIIPRALRFLLLAYSLTLSPTSILQSAGLVGLLVVDWNNATSVAEFLQNWWLLRADRKTRTENTLLAAGAGLGD
jgi:hypothetical protein